MMPCCATHEKELYDGDKKNLTVVTYGATHNMEQNKQMNRKIIISLLLSLALQPVAAQRITVQKKSVDCGKTAYSMPVTAEFELRNKGLRKLRIEDVQVSCGCLEAQYPKDEISAGEKFTLKLTYDAKQLGHFVKTARIVSNGSKQPLYLTMKGIVVEELEDYSGTYPYVFGDLRSDKNNIEFDDVNKGDHPVQEIHIRNMGTSLLQPNIMHLPPFLSAVVTPEWLRPGHSGKITVSLNSAKLHDYGLTQTSVYIGNKLGEKVSDDNEIPVSAVLLPSFDGQTAANRKFAPQMELSAESIDINFEGKSKKKAVVKIANKGRTDLQISSLQMFTGGLRMTLGKRVVKPGETTELKITAYKEGLSKARSKPRVLMITNDPDHPKVVISINVR